MQLSNVGETVQGGIESELVSVKIAAQLLDLSERSVSRLAATGRMPRPIRLGGLNKWRRADLLAWLQSGCPEVKSGK